MRGRLALREHCRAKPTATVRFSRKLWSAHASLRRYAVDKLESLSAQTPRWLSSILNLVTLLSFSL